MLALALCLWGDPALAGVYDDPRVARWSALYRAGKRDELVADLEADLRSEAPHPLASWAWSRVQLDGGSSVDALASVDADLAEALGDTPIAMQWHNDEDHEAILARWPAPDPDEEPMVVQVATWTNDEEGYEAAATSWRLRRGPEGFIGLWNLSEDAAWDAVSGAIVAEAALSDGDRAFVDGASAPGANDGDRLALVDAWIAANGPDPWAFRYRAFRLEGLRRYEEAAEAFRDNWELWPFHANRGEIEMLVRLGRPDDAARVADEFALAWEPDPARREAAAVLNLAQAYRGAGERGTARTLLVGALERWPEDAELLAELAALEADSGRWAEAAATWDRVGELSPPQRASWLRALTSGGRVDEARAWCEPSTVPARVDVLEACVAAWEAAGQPTLALSTRALALRPDDVQLRLAHARALLAAGRRAEARGVIDGVLRHTPGDRRALEVRIATLRPEEVDPWLAAWTEAHPTEASIWAFRADRLPKGDEAALVALRREALAHNPRRGWAWEALYNAAPDDELESLLAAWEADLPSHTPGQRHVHQTTRMWYLTWRLGNGEPRADELLALADAYEAEGGNPATAAYHRARALEGQGAYDRALVELERSVGLTPDWEAPLNRLFQSSEIYRAGGGAAGLRAAYRRAERDPFSGEDLKDFAEWSIQWGGSAIIGLEALERAAVVDPDAGVERLRAKAYGMLGAPVQRYEKEYGRAGSLANSARYVAWYEGARRDALTSEGDVRLELPPPDVSDGGLHLTGRVTIRWPDGRVLVRADDPVTGKPVEIRVGDAAITATYDDRGRLTGISSAAGHAIGLVYDDAGQIVRLTQPHRTVSFDYVGGRPTRMVVEQDGQTSELRVTYDANGEIASTESDDGLSGLAITEVFSELLKLVRALEQRSVASFGPFAPPDPELDRLRDDWTAASFGAEAAFADASLALARHLFDHAASDPGRLDEAEALALEAWMAGAGGRRSQPAAVRAVSLWHEIALAAHPDGLDRERHAAWTRMTAWLSDAAATRGKTGRTATAALARIESKPLQLLPAARWIERSALTNPGFWQVWRHGEVVPGAKSDAALQAVLVRANGDVVVGSDAGLAVQSRGHFVHWTWDDGRSRWARDGKAGASSDVRALAETPDGALWVGTANGLVRVDAGVDGATRAWRTVEDGLPAPAVDHLAVHEGRLLVGTRSGLRVVSSDGTRLEAPSGLAGTAVRGIAVHPGRPALVLADDGVWSLDGDVATHLRDDVVDAIAHSPADGLVLYAVGTRLGAWRGPDGPEVPLMARQDVLVEKAIHGLAPFELSPGRWAVAALTDQGLGVWHDQHFEHTTLDFRLVDGRPNVRALASRDGRLQLLVADGLLSHEAEQVARLEVGPVTDLVSRDGTTWVAHAGGLGVVTPESREVRTLQRMDVAHLAIGGDGSIYAHDGTRILRVAPDGSAVEVLFDAQPAGEDPLGRVEVRDLAVTSDGALWVVCGPSVFRWKDGAAEEFNWKDDAERFPLRSDLPWRVIETLGGEVWVVGSNEGHRSHRGVPMSGGVVAFDGEAFHELRLRDESSAWFASSYTPVDDDTAIVGTTRGFVRHHGGWRTYADLKDASYEALRERVPSLFLGTRGARLDDVWLFGTAGGVVAWSDGRWFTPERLNRLLPGDEALGGYGARAVHAIEVDDAGRVFVGNDVGLLVYDAGGASAASFLIWNQMDDAPFLDAERAKLQAEADAFRAAAVGSPIGAVLASVDETRREIDALETVLDPTVLATARMHASSQTGGSDGDAGARDRTAELRATLEERAQRQRQLLGEIETRYPALYQLLEAKPFDLAALRSRLAPDQLVVQFLPTPSALYVHLVDAREARVVTVSGVSQEELATRANRVAAHLGSDAARGVKVTSVASAAYDPIDDLAWLYQALYAPIEAEIAAKRQVFVVPVGELTTVPFAALVHSREPLTYAVERFRDTSFGVVPSLYLFDLATGASDTAGAGALVVGDPDGTLPGARAEATAIETVLGDATLLTGHAATRAAVTDGMQGRRYVHLGTHGHLVPDDPYRSYLVLAGGQRLDMLDVLGLPLGDTRLVVLSACETGVGRRGLEYATLARSFAQAGAPSVVATLWTVPDLPSQRLVEAFYGNLAAGEDHFRALAHAQRQMLADPSARENPAEWAGYVVFGRP